MLWFSFLQVHVSPTSRMTLFVECFCEANTGWTSWRAKQKKRRPKFEASLKFGRIILFVDMSRLLFREARAT
jgi:hypothetical protein